MPNTYTQLLFHVVFSTKNLQCALLKALRENDVPYGERCLTWALLCHDVAHAGHVDPNPRVALRSTRGYSKVTATRSHLLLFGHALPPSLDAKSP